MALFRTTTWWRLLGSVALLASLSLVVDLRQTWTLLRSLDARWLAPLLVVNTVAYLLFAARWEYFCRQLALPLSFGRSLRGVYLFQVTSQVVPSAFLSEAARFTVFPKSTSKATILKSIALDRLANLLSLVAGVTLLLPYYWREDPAPGLRWLLPVPALVVAGALLAVAFLRARIPRERRPWSQPLEFLKLLFRKRLGLPPLALGLLLFLVVGVELGLSAGALGVPFEQALRLVPLAPLMLLGVSLLPISFADWGTRELVALAVLRSTGLPSEDLVAISLLVGVTNLLACLPGLWFASRVTRS